MSKTLETKINRFDGGIVNDPRDTQESTCRVVTNFDIITNPRKLTPYRSNESADSSGSTSRKQNFCVALRTGTTYKLYGLGVVSGATRAEVLMKDLTTGGSADLSDNTWATPSNNSSASGATSMDLFVYYKKTGLIYGSRSSRYIWAFDPSSVAAWDDTAYDYGATFTYITQGLVHSKDDVLYLGIDNKIISKNGSGAFAVSLTLPTHYYVTSISEYGNYLAIGCASLVTGGNSRVFLWDRDSSLTTLSESIDWGSGTLKVLEEVDGVLMGISLNGANSTVFADRVIFRYLNGNKAEKFKEITGTNSTTLLIAKQKVDNRLYFMMSISLNGTTREGVWSLGRSSPGQPFALVHERTPSSTALVNGNLFNFFILGDFMFQSYSDNGTYTLVKTIEPVSYSANSIYETKKFNTGDLSITNKLVGVSVNYEPIDGGTVTMKYRIQGETSYTTIFTHTATLTTNSFSAINITATGATLPEYKEIEFQIISTGGVVITGYSFKGEVLGKRNYE